MVIAAWVVFGLIAGVIAKLFIPGHDPGGIFVSMFLGIAGAVIAGFVSVAAGIGGTTAFDARNTAIAIVVASAVVIGYRLIMAKASA